MDKVDSTMAKIAEQRDIANEIADAISDPSGHNALDEVNGLISNSTQLIVFQDELRAELEELEQGVLDERLAGADHVPVHIPPGARKEEIRECIIVLFSDIVHSFCPGTASAVEDEDAQLRELQAALAM